MPTGVMNVVIKQHGANRWVERGLRLCLVMSIACVRSKDQVQGEANRLSCMQGHWRPMVCSHWSYLPQRRRTWHHCLCRLSMFLCMNSLPWAFACGFLGSCPPGLKAHFGGGSAVLPFLILLIAVVTGAQAIFCELKSVAQGAGVS